MALNSYKISRTNVYLKKHIWYNIDMEKEIFNINKNQLSYGRGYVYSLQYHLICGIRRIVPLPGYNRYRYLKTDMTETGKRT